VKVTPPVVSPRRSRVLALRHRWHPPHNDDARGRRRAGPTGPMSPRRSLDRAAAGDRKQQGEIAGAAVQVVGT
jgi:hypothetical protein